MGSMCRSCRTPPAPESHWLSLASVGRAPNVFSALRPRVKNTDISVILRLTMNKPPYPHPVIAREGWPFLAGIVLISILVAVWSVPASLPFWLLSLFVLQFFRDPARVAPDGDQNVLSPADGRIVAVEQVRDPY